MKSISSRVILGYVSLLAILMAIAGLGISMVGKLGETTNSIIDKELAIGLAAQEVRDLIVRLRQKEKSLFISIGRRQDDKRNDAPAQEFASLNAKIDELEKTIDRFAALPVSADAVVLAKELKSDLKLYQQAVADIYRRIERGEIRTARDADDALIPFKKLVRFDREGMKNVSELPVAELIRAGNEAKLSAKQTGRTILLFSVLAAVVGVLAAWFTVGTVRRIERANVELRSNLEVRVEQRTRELKQTNEQLVRTLTDLANAEDILVKTEKLASLGRLVASIAHELNTPIGNALLASTTMRDQARQFHQATGAGIRRADLEKFVSCVDSGVDIANRNLESAAELISNFKQVAADQTSDQRRVFVIEALVHGVVVMLEPMLRRAGVAIESKIPALSLDSYPGALIQVLTNLITNACVHAFDDWTDARGPRTIRLDAFQSGSDPRADLAIVVKDNGNGISPENQSRVFEHFFTTRTGKGGTGLGLSIVSTLISGQLGGRIELQSELGKGTCFTLTLPLVAPQAAIKTTACHEPSAA